MTGGVLTDPAVVRARLNEGLVLAHGIAVGSNHPRELTPDLEATVLWAIQQAIAHHKTLAAAISMRELEAKEVGAPPLTDTYDVWAEAA